MSPEYPGLDGWNCKWPVLSRSLRDANELVILDALSFPWELLTDEHRHVPVIVMLPADLGAQAQSSVLGDALFRALTPMDRLLHHDVEVQAALTRRWRLPACVWVTPCDPSIASYVEALGGLSRSRLTHADGDVGAFVMEPKDLITRHLVEHGAHQRGTLNVVLELVEPGQTLLDAGAHVGTFSVPLCRAVQPGGHLIAIEGDPVNALLLRENLDQNELGRASTVLEVVLGRDEESMVARGEVGNSGATRFATAPVGSLDTVKGTTLDRLAEQVGRLGDVALIKLDLEGVELDALLGGSALIGGTRPTLICEVSSQLLERRGSTVGELGQYFSGIGYVVFVITGQRNFRGQEWEVTKVEQLERWPEAHFDVVAVPEESPHLSLLDSKALQ